jgi:hypothetical protein
VTPAVCIRRICGFNHDRYGFQQRKTTLLRLHKYADRVPLPHDWEGFSDRYRYTSGLKLLWIVLIARNWQLKRVSGPSDFKVAENE